MLFRLLVNLITWSRMCLGLIRSTVQIPNAPNRNAMWAPSEASIIAEKVCFYPCVLVEDNY